MKESKFYGLKISRPGNDAEMRQLLQRPLPDRMIERRVRKIIKGVRKNGDEALKKYSERFDGVTPVSIAVPQEEISDALKKVPDKLKDAIRAARRNIETFHKTNGLREFPLVETSPGVFCRLKNLPVEKVGLYIPGGTAPLISTVLMLGIPAVIAGCREIILCTPPERNGRTNPAVIYTASSLGISKIYRAGGAQAIAAMAYGTETIPEVDKIFGPGNSYVTTAKQIVSLDSTAIDMPAGPSELMIIADGSAYPEFLAADLLGQAEHGTDSQVILFSTSSIILEKTLIEIRVQLTELDRKRVAAGALKNSRFVFIKDRKKILRLINEYAPEHLIIATRDPEKDAGNIINAGSVFLGNFTPESAGDYASGPNHTLPTGGWARSLSGLTVDSFRKTVSFQKMDQDGLKRIGPVIELLAAAEGLSAHAASVSVRLKKIIRQGDPNEKRF